MQTKYKLRYFVLTGLLGVVVGFMSTSKVPTAKADTGAVTSCITRSFFHVYNTPGAWQSLAVCNSNEVAISAGGFCSGAGSMVGVSTTTGTADNKVWLMCTQSGNAYWYAMCCNA